ncbi:hypothetical protein Tco_0700490 [Tanacetum coccineum]
MRKPLSDQAFASPYKVAEIVHKVSTSITALLFTIWGIVREAEEKKAAIRKILKQRILSDEAAVNQYLKPADKQTEMILEMQLKEERQSKRPIRPRTLAKLKEDNMMINHLRN